MRDEQSNSSARARYIRALCRWANREVEIAFPEAVSEGKVEFDKLCTTLGDNVDTGRERFSFTWAGKQDCISLLQTPSRATLVPCPEESVNFDETENIFIEGDNLEVLKLWGDEIFPVRFPVKPLIMLDPEFGVSMDDLRGKLTFYPDDTPPGKWSGMVRGSPTRYEKSDGEAIAAAIRNAQVNPVSRPVDPKKLKRPPNLYKLKSKTGDKDVEKVVSVPIEEDEAEDTMQGTSIATPTHTEIQWRLLELGSRMGLNVWAPKADRGRCWNGQKIANLSK